MSRHHKTGNLPARDLRMAAQQQIAKAMYDSIHERVRLKLSQTATVFTFMLQYMSVSLDCLLDELDGDNCDFSIKLQNKGRTAMKACDEFIKVFEPLITPDNKDEWANYYGQFQYTMDNYFCREDQAYQKGSKSQRANEIVRAAALRYHDPYETNPQRCFEAGFREGAAYADLHPIDTVIIHQNGAEKRITIRELLSVYAESKHASVELKALKQPSDE